MMRFRFLFVMVDKPKHYLLYECIKRHFKSYDAKNLDEAHQQLAQNLMSEFGLLDRFKVERLRHGAWKMHIGNAKGHKLTVGYGIDIYPIGN